MYQDFKQKYWWYGLKRDVAAHVAKCDVCQRVKAEHQRPAGLLHPLKDTRVEMGRNWYGFYCWTTPHPCWV
jgi:hypothetical protein